MTNAGDVWLQRLLHYRVALKAEAFTPTRAAKLGRRLAVLVSLLAIVAAVLGMLPNGIELRPSDVSRYNHFAGPASTIHAGGWAVVIWAVGIARLARQLWRWPGRHNGVILLLSAFILTFLCACGWRLEDNTLDRQVLLWPAEQMIAVLALTGALLFIAIPIALFVRGAKRPSLPNARVVAGG